MSQIGKYFSLAPAIETLTGDTGGPVGPTGGNINLLGTAGRITVTGNPGTSTLTWDVGATVATQYVTNAGTATPALNILNVLGGNNISTAGAGNTVTINVSGTTNHALQLGNATGSLTSLGVATNGQLPIGSVGADPVLNTLTAGTNISIANGAGTITISTSGPASFTWSVITANQTAAVNHGYICNKAGTLALLLPAASVVGDLLEVTGINTANGIQITQGAGQQVFFGTSSTTLGGGGSLTSINIRDSLRLVCVVANLTWNVISSQGNWTIV